MRMNFVFSAGVCFEIFAVYQFVIFSSGREFRVDIAQYFLPEEMR
jgi:hypothetical protein